MKRTNVVVDEKLVQQALKVTGEKSFRGLVDFALREILRRQRQKKLLQFRGKVKWEGDLEQMRNTR